MIGDIRKHYYSNIVQSARECGYKQLKTLHNIEKKNVEMAENQFRKESILENGPEIEVFTFLNLISMLFFNWRY